MKIKEKFYYFLKVTIFFIFSFFFLYIKFAINRVHKYVLLRRNFRVYRMNSWNYVR